MPKKGWGPAARAAALAARKGRPNGKRQQLTTNAYGKASKASPARKASAQRQIQKRYAGTDSLSLRSGGAVNSKGTGSLQGGPRTQPHKVLGSQGNPVQGSRPGKPMKAPGVAKPTGPHAFTTPRPAPTQRDMHGNPQKADYSTLPARLKVPWLDKHGNSLKYKKGK